MPQGSSHRSSSLALDLLDTYTSDEDIGSRYDENDIVLSPLWPRSRNQSFSDSVARSRSVASMESAENPAEGDSRGSSDVDERDQDLVLITPGSTILSDHHTPSRSPTVLSTYSSNTFDARNNSFDSAFLTSTPNTTMPSWFEDYENSQRLDKSKQRAYINKSGRCSTEDDEESDLDLTGAIRNLRLSSRNLSRNQPTSSFAATAPAHAATTTSSIPKFNAFIVFSEDTPRALTPASVSETIEPTKNFGQPKSLPRVDPIKEPRGSRHPWRRGRARSSTTKAPRTSSAAHRSPSKPNHKQPVHSPVNTGTAISHKDTQPGKVLTNSQRRSAQRRRARARELENAEEKAPRISNASHSVPSPTKNRSNRSLPVLISRSVSRAATTASAHESGTDHKSTTHRERHIRRGREYQQMGNQNHLLRTGARSMYGSDEVGSDEDVGILINKDGQLYEAAVSYMDTVLASPRETYSTSERLAIAQALLAELGIVNDISSIPLSLNVAKTMLSAQVHINILDYLRWHPKASEALALRTKFPNRAGRAEQEKRRRRQIEKEKRVSQAKEGLRKCLLPSNRALKEDLKNRKATLSQVKMSGLRDLLAEGRWNYR